MDTYGHLFPDSEDLGRGAVETALAGALAEQERPVTAQAQASTFIGGEPACRPGSVHPRERGPAAIHLGLPLPTASCGLPASIGRATLNRSRRPRAPEGAWPL